MAGLPPKPREYDDYHRYPSDDRGRPAPMAPDRYAHPHPRDYYSSRSPHPPRSRASYAGDSYIATDSYVAAPAADTYIASGYDRRGDEERYRAEWDRYHAHERERRAYERDNARYDHERGYDRRHGDARDRDYPPYSERNRRWEGRSSPRRPTGVSYILLYSTLLIIACLKTWCVFYRSPGVIPTATNFLTSTTISSTFSSSFPPTHT